MRHLSVVPTVLASLLLVPALATAQDSSDDASPWEVGGGIGVGLNEPADAFDWCNPSGTRGAVSLRGSYAIEPWFRVGVVATGHSKLTTDNCILPNVYRAPGTHREYGEGIREGSGYVTTGARVVLEPGGSFGSVQPVVIAGVGRIWGKDLQFPELGVGADVPAGGIRFRFEALVRWLSVPYDLVRLGLTEERGAVELSRTPLDEEHFPLLFRASVGWRP